MCAPAKTMGISDQDRLGLWSVEYHKPLRKVWWCQLLRVKTDPGCENVSWLLGAEQIGVPDLTIMVDTIYYSCACRR
jgi:hypothetical protein